jgi:predicted transcriptional regulator
MTELEVHVVEPISRELDQVLVLHRASKATLGFLPDGGFKDRADRGTLFVAKRSSEVVGYVLFDVVGDSVRLRHLCVSVSARNQNVARFLVDELKRRHSPYCRNIVLECRRDYGLAPMWQALRFRAVNERRGRSEAGHLLTVWEFDFGHPTLFTEVVDGRDLACVDQMVLEDLVVDRPEGRHTRYLTEDWVDELVQLCVTDEVFVETHDASEDALRRTLLAGAHSCRNLSSPDAPWEQYIEIVSRAAPRAGTADHRHLARAIAGGATYFVTRDEKILCASQRINDEVGILIVSPDGLLDVLDRQRREERYEPAVLQGTSLVLERLPAAHVEAFVQALLNHGEAERAYTLRQILRDAFANPETAEVLVVREVGGHVIAGVVRNRSRDRVDVTCLRVRGTGRLTDAVARQIVFQQRQHAADTAIRRVSVTDDSPSAAVLRALPMESFERSDGRWNCDVVRGIHDAADVLGGTRETRAAATYERRHWPAKVMGAGLITFMISIEPSFAERLFDARLAETTLFAREPVLGLSREHVYYRSPGNSKSLAGPARVVWYVKQRPPGHPVGHVRAISHLVEVEVDRPRTLYSRHARLGVWTQAQVAKAAEPSGRAMALRLADTELLERPVSIGELRSIYEGEGKRFSAPQGPVSISERMFCLIYGASSSYV